MTDPDDLLANPSTSKHQQISNIDDVLQKIGCGLSQYLLEVIIIFVDLTFGYQLLIMYFMGNDPPWTCTSKNSSEFCQKHYRQTFSQTDDDFDKRCSLNRSEWKYTVAWKYSSVTEFDLACGKEYIAALANSALFIGWGVAGVVTAVLADKYGRKKAMVVSIFCIGGFAIGSCYVTAMWQLILLRIFIGACTGTLCCVDYIYLCEFTSEKYRSLCGNTLVVWYSIKLILLAVLAMYVQEWRKLEFYAALPSVLVFFIALLLPESPRWLHEAGKTERADKILQKIVKINKSKIGSFTLVREDSQTSKEFEGKQFSYIDLLKKKSTFLFVTTLAFAWFACNLVYYGVYLESSNLGGSIYVNFILSSLAELVASVASIYVIDKGRRKSYIICFFVSTFVFVGLSIVSTGWKYGSVIRVTLAMMGKFLVTISINSVYLWTVELYPTIIRSQGMTICQIAGKVGSASSPFITSNLQSVYKPLPFIIMACVCLLASVCALPLSETKGRPVCEKFESFLQDPVVEKVVDPNEIEPLLQK